MTVALRKLHRAMVLTGCLTVIMGDVAAQQHDERSLPTDAILEQKLNAISLERQGSQNVIRLSLSKPINIKPTLFSTVTPPRVVLDFSDVKDMTGITRKEINDKDIKSYQLIASEGRLRLVCYLNRPMTQSMVISGNDVVLTIQDNAVAPDNKEAAADASAHKDAPTTEVSAVEPVQGAAVLSAPTAPLVDPAVPIDIDFRRLEQGGGKFILKLGTHSTKKLNVKTVGAQQLVVSLLGVALPEDRLHAYDVRDFGTPIDQFRVKKTDEGVQIIFDMTGAWTQSAYQLDDRFILEVRPVVARAQATNNNGVETQLSAPTGVGSERLSLNFQNIDIRALLQVIADFTKMNIIASESVKGDISIRLQDVPWQQAMDIILQSKGLAMRKSGGVIMVAPQEDIAKQDKLQLEAQQQNDDLEVVQTATYRLNYQKVAELEKVLKDSQQKLLSKRGSLFSDIRTNTLVVQDLPVKLKAIQKLISILDIPVQQVQIEARIVEATDTFSKSLGVRLGMNALSSQTPGQSLGGSNRFSIGGPLKQNVNATSQSMTTADPLGDGLSVNLPATGANGSSAGVMSLVLFKSNLSRFLNLELSALEADGKGKVVSSPRVVTADKKEALIETGTEVPYTQSSANGGTVTTAFRKANLSLKVTPQITPEGQVVLDIEVTKDSVGLQTSSGLSINTKRVRTQVLVENGGTVVIGGIYTQEENRDITRIPLLGSLPFIGGLFRNTAMLNTRNELLVFITPHVLDSLNNNTSAE